MKFVREAHKWIGLILGLQFLLWMLSGFGMALLPKELVRGEHRAASATAPQTLDTAPARQTPSVTSGTKEVSLQAFEGRPVYRHVTTEGVRLVDAIEGGVIEIDETRAHRIAEASYSGPGSIVGTTRLEEATLAIRDHDAPAWRVDFDDGEQTSIYVSASDGQILEHRNNYWRGYDILWMLHIMDYQNRTSFNHPLIITIALIVFWLGVSGLILWFDSFRREDFDLIGKWRARGHQIPLQLRDSDNRKIATVNAHPQQRLYDAMAEGGYALPSSCGGGGTCGLCRTNISPDAPVLAADRRNIDELEITAGYRLACQHRVDAPLSVTLPRDLLNAQHFEAEIVSVNYIAPALSQVRLRLNAPLDFQAGSYMQVDIPPYSATLEDIRADEALHAAWKASSMPTAFGTDDPVTRTYSLASAPKEFDRDILLTVRLAMAGPDTPGVAVGIGSAYLATLSPGDRLMMSGPFGDFRIREADEERVFIGGGAGIGPLRAMIVDQLVNQSDRTPMSLWYGVRTTRDVAYGATFDDLAERYRNFSWRVALSETDNDPGPDNEIGLIHEVVRDRYLASHPDPGRCSFYVCGPPPMLAAVLALLQSHGVPEDRIAFDDFGI